MKQFTVEVNFGFDWENSSHTTDLVYYAEERADEEAEKEWAYEIVSEYIFDHLSFCNASKVKNIVEFEEDEEDEENE